MTDGKLVALSEKLGTLKKPREGQLVELYKRLPVTPGEAGKEVVARAARGMVGTVGSIADAAALAGEKLPGSQYMLGVQQSRQAATLAQRLVEKIPTSPKLEDSFLLGDVPEALGSTVPFLAGGLVAGGSRAAAALIPAYLGGLAQASSQYRDAEWSGAGEADRWKSYLLGFGVGTSEAVPLSRMLGRVNRASKGSLSRALVDMAIEGGEEAGQEAFQGFASNAIAAHLVAYDEDRELTEGLLRSAGAGGFSGVLLSALFSAKARAAGGPEKAGALPATPPEVAEKGGAVPASAAPPRAGEEPAPVQLGSEPEPAVHLGSEEAAEPPGVAAREQDERPDDEVRAAVQAAWARGADRPVREVDEAEDEKLGRAAAFLRARGVEPLFMASEDGKPTGRGGAYAGGFAVIDAAAPEQSLRDVARHELLHHVHEARGDTWRALYDVVAREDPKGLARAQKAYEAAAGRAKVKLSPGLAEEEGLSAYAEDLGRYLDVAFEDPARLVRIARGAEGRGFLEDLVDAAIKLLNRVGFGIETLESRRLAKLRDEIARSPIEQDLDPRVAARLAFALKNALNSTLDIQAPQAGEVVASATEQAPLEAPAVAPGGAAAAGETTEPGGGPTAPVGEGGPASMPTEAALFGREERAPRRRKEGAPVRATQANLLDVQPGDLPGQRSLLDESADDPTASTATPRPSADRPRPSTAPESAPAAPAEKAPRKPKKAKAAKEAKPEPAPEPPKKKPKVRRRQGRRTRFPSGAEKEPATVLDVVVASGGFDMRLGVDRRKTDEARRVNPQAVYFKGGEYEDLWARYRPKEIGRRLTGFLYGPDSKANAKGISPDEMTTRLLEAGFLSREQGNVGERPTIREMMEWLDEEVHNDRPVYRPGYEPEVVDTRAQREAEAEEFYFDQLVDELGSEEAARAHIAEMGRASESAGPVGWMDMLRLNREAEQRGDDEVPFSLPLIKYQVVYHGGAADFDQFDTAFIGTGEGAQAYGWGLYFAGKKEIAEWYREKVAHGGRRVAQPKVVALAQEYLDAWPNQDKAIEALLDEASAAADDPDFAALYEAAANWILGQGQKGKLYEVDLAPADDEYLLWDELTDEQPARIEAALRATDWYKFFEEASDLYNQRNPTGASIYRWLQQDMTPQEASETLLAAGIRGIKYRDASARASEGDSFNYVIFDAADAKITAKFALDLVEQVYRGEKPLGAVRLALRRAPVSRGLYHHAFDLPDAGTVENLRRRVVDYFQPVVAWQAALREQGATGVNVVDPFRLWRGKAKDRVERFRRRYVDTLVEVAGKAKIEHAEIQDFLRWRHAEERNEAIRQIDPGNHAGSGITDQTARRALAALAADPRAAAFETIGRIWDRMNREKLRGLVADGLIEQREVEALNAKYKHWAPLKDMPEEEIAFSGLGRGMDIRGKEYKRAFGRTTPGENPLEFGFLSFATAVTRGEKNRVGQAFLEAIETYPDPAVAQVSVPERRKIIGPDGLVRWAYDPAFKLADNVLSVKRAGKEIHILVQPKHAELALAMKGLSVEHGNEVVQGFARATRIFASLATRWNPAFPPFNLIRDAGGTLITFGGEHGFARAAGAIAHLPVAWRAVQAEIANPGKAAGVWAEATREYIRAGGLISYLDLNNVQEEVKRLQKAMSRPNESRPLRWMRRLGAILEGFSDVLENGTRVAVFKSLRDAGWSVERAAVYAKGVTTNFETRGEIGPWLNAFWAFANAGIQGIDRHGVQAMKAPGVRRAVFGLATFAAGWAFALRALMDEEDWEAIPEWEKAHNLILPAGKGHHVTVPLPHVFRWFHYLGYKTGEFAMGEESALGSAGAIAARLVDEMNPLGGVQHPGQMLAPTAVDPFVELWINQNWAGKTIYPEKFPGQYASDSALSWPDTADSYKALARWMNAATGGDEIEGGLVDVHPESIEHVVRFTLAGTGSTLDQLRVLLEKAVDPEQRIVPEDVPVVRRIWRRTSPFFVHQEFKAAAEQVEIEAARDKLTPAAPASPLGGLAARLRAVKRRIGKLEDAAERAEGEQRAALEDMIEAAKADFTEAARAAGAK